MTEVDLHQQRKRRVLAGLLFLFFLVSLLLALPLPGEGPISPAAVAEFDPVISGSPAVPAAAKIAVATTKPEEILATAESTTKEVERENKTPAVQPQADQEMTPPPRVTTMPPATQPASPTLAGDQVVAKETTTSSDQATEFEPETGEDPSPTRRPTATLEDEIPASATSTNFAVTGFAEETAEAISPALSPSPSAAEVEEATPSPAVGITPSGVGPTATQPAETLTPAAVVSPEPLEARLGETPAATETQPPVVDSGNYYINENMAGEVAQEDEAVADRPTAGSPEAATPNQIAAEAEADLSAEIEEVPPPNGLPTTGMEIKESYSLYGFVWGVIIVLISTGLAKALNWEFFGL